MDHLSHVDLPGRQQVEERRYFFVVDTNQRVGQFEDEDLAAAMTGRFVEDHREEAEAIALRFRQDFPDAYAWIKEALLELPDEEFGQLCIVQSIETPGWVNDGRGNFFRDHLAPATQTMYMQHPWYAYLSVRLTFDRPLLPTEVAFLCQRAGTYAMETSSFSIERFRLLRTETIITCLEARMPNGTPVQADDD